jgi:DNA helicase-2/ATP-dependent DNA helicase PcrA
MPIELDSILHSDAPIAVVEAPAGCGKTHSAVEYAKQAAADLKKGNILLLSHTHAACSVFENRTRDRSNRINVNTIDGFCMQLVSPYAAALNLPNPIEGHVGNHPGGIRYDHLSEKAVELLARAPSIASVVAGCYPVIILDEHQDASIAQHKIMQILNEAGGSKLRIFGDPMQAIYDDDEGIVDWPYLWQTAHGRHMLDTPHRWTNNIPLGKWILDSRTALKAGQQLRADQQIITVTSSARLAGFRRISDRSTCSRIIQQFQRLQGSKVILAFANDMVRSIAEASGWRIVINEGARIETLEDFVGKIIAANGKPSTMAGDFLDFMAEMGAGLGDDVRNPLKDRLGPIRINKQKAGQKQTTFLGPLEFIYASPDHKGIAQAAKAYFQQPPHNYHVRRAEPIRILISLGSCEDPRLILSSLARARRNKTPPDAMVSTIHKAKGMEFDHVLVLPVDRYQYPQNAKAAKRLYVALSRARCSIHLVTSSDAPSPHFR